MLSSAPKLARTLVVVAAATAIFVVPSAASASSLNVESSTLKLIDADGATDVVTVTKKARTAGGTGLGNDVVVTDTAGISSFPTGCAPLDAPVTQVSCAMESGISRFE